eukprot:TRINITY_DN29411_c0_g1_i1.p1 TRINITY_DN29411_c0_g1~~TRINITY_DN29411_c0_g1_i1.p1  ORF type:complete len:172 (-),score=23.85 TRINITY_DN29411_c0_g1_i1:62-577(-)
MGEAQQVVTLVVVAVGLVVAGYMVGSIGAGGGLGVSFTMAPRDAADALAASGTAAEELAVAAAEAEILEEEELLDAPDPRAAVNESDPNVLRVIGERMRRREALKEKAKETVLELVKEVKAAAANPGGLKEEETVANVSNVPLQYGATDISQLEGSTKEETGNRRRRLLEW